MWIERPKITVRGNENKNTGYLFSEQVDGANAEELEDGRFQVQILSNGAIVNDMTFDNRVAALNRCKAIMRSVEGDETPYDQTDDE